MTDPTSTPTSAHHPVHAERSPWPALWALVIGFL